MVYGSRGINVSHSFANASSDGVIPEIQMTVAEHAQKVEQSLGELNCQSMLI